MSPFSDFQEEKAAGSSKFLIPAAAGKCRGQVRFRFSVSSQKASVPLGFLDVKTKI